MKKIVLLCVATVVIWGNARANEFDDFDAGTLGSAYDRILKSDYCQDTEIKEPIIIKQKMSSSNSSIIQKVQFFKNRNFLIEGQNKFWDAQEFILNFNTGEIDYSFNGTSNNIPTSCFSNLSNAEKCIFNLNDIYEMMISMISRISSVEDEDERQNQINTMKCVQTVVYKFGISVTSYRDVQLEKFYPKKKLVRKKRKTSRY